MTFTLCADLDQVCGDYLDGVRHFFARDLGVAPASLPEPKFWDFTKCGWGIKSLEHFTELHLNAVRRGLFRSLKPMDGVSRNLHKLSDEGVHIRILTHRLVGKGMHAVAAADTVAWLDVENIPYRDLCFQGNKTEVIGDCYIDDAPHNIEQIRAAGGYCIIMDAPYNGHLEGDRAHNWDEAYVLINARRAAVEAARAAA
jgi:5'-nucleotidase